MRMRIDRVKKAGYFDYQVLIKLLFPQTDISLIHPVIDNKQMILSAGIIKQKITKTSHKSRNLQ